ncbi:hypothetical protein G647_08723 [Cladophialophora carrionii CBS 160.54]|uniref:Clr5 domain-containing protein n=1 Tax=Cladophialophora carrionii CBS 160.54 TaxID=1279043 RepID=V9CYI4_9EURO|nr:uncharacterized protein G647_08723 [Cladophialophora carrionii CBS 160.54]ETI19710.1 hypothetical protein G647_08723 [Cladophialophora carrionii CBS 160.54]
MPAAGLTIPRSQWLEHQQTIHDLYVTQGLELKAIRQHLIDHHSFSASIPQYKRKLKEWKYVKNLKASVCRAIGSGLERRGLTHDTATATNDGLQLQMAFKFTRNQILPIYRALLTASRQRRSTARLIYRHHMLPSC